MNDAGVPNKTGVEILKNHRKIPEQQGVEITTAPKKIFCDACRANTGRTEDGWFDSIICPKCHHRVR